SDYQQRLFEANIPITMFGVENVQQTYDALTQKGVHFTVEPTTRGSAKMAIFNDTCGNLIQIVEQ
ncbi:VOC family protein, partial [Staphylococcus haemolyticus]|uniref:VOC family protein n=1 Tax=Staphylococcus haemolyticus TaxID=1283 RepID=UPI0015D82544